MPVAIFVNSIVMRPNGRIVVEASNGSNDGPPFARFEVDARIENRIVIGKRFRFTVEEWPDDRG